MDNSQAMDFTDDEVRDWIRSVLERTQDTATGLARKAGLDPSTLTRFMREDGKATLTRKSIAKISQAVGETPYSRRIGLTPAASPEVFDGGPERIADQIDDAPIHVREAITALLRDRKNAKAFRMQARTIFGQGFLGEAIAIVVKQEPQRGDIVCANLLGWKDISTTTIFRVFEPPYLVALPNSFYSPDDRRPLLVDGERVILNGVVTETLLFYA
jgi:hypothetical protein